MFVGYPFGKKGWKVCDLETQKTFIGRDVVFQENLFPFAKSAVQAMDNENPISQPTAQINSGDATRFRLSEPNLGLDLFGQ